MNFQLPHFLIVLIASAFSSCFAEEKKPNVVFILCDDLGIGDVQSFNPERGKIKTPHFDRIAKQGMSFTDAHSGSSVCTPTRYGLLTGRYAWRTKLQSGVVKGFGDCLIDKDRPTLSAFLQDNGYHCGIVGKWHLNMKFLSPSDGKTELAGNEYKFTAPVGATSPDGPVNRGFDYFYGIHHARSMKAIIEHDQVTKHADVETFLPSLEQKSISYLKERANDSKPFFLYVPLGSPHTPIVPTGKWQGASGLNKYADFVMQTDEVIGNIVQCLDSEGLGENTILILSSDNGCSRRANIKELRNAGHFVSADFRGSKADIWEGGHRVPFVIRWPNQVEPDSTCKQTICFTDVFATIAECIGATPPENSCEDSVSFYPALFGNQIKSSRAGIVHHSSSGHFAYRSGDWKLILARGSGGWSHPNEANVSPTAPKAQLYRMSSDSGEQNNLFIEEANIAERLLEQLELDVTRGRSTDGPASKNDLKRIKVWK